MQAERIYAQERFTIGAKLVAEADIQLGKEEQRYDLIKQVQKQQNNDGDKENRRADIRANSNARILKFYQEELNSLEQNQAANVELSRAIAKVEDAHNQQKAVSIILDGKKINIQKEYTGHALKNLKILNETFSIRTKMGKEASNELIVNEKRVAEIESERFAEKETQAMLERQMRGELTEEEQKYFEEQQQRLIEGQNNLFEEKQKALEKEKGLSKENEQAESDSFDQRLEQQKEFNEEIDTLQQQNSEDQQEAAQQTNDEVADVEKESHKTRLDQWKDYAQKAAEISQKISEATSMVTNSLGSMFGQLGSYYAEQVQAFADKIAVLDEEKEAALERVALSEEERQEKENEIALQRIELEYATSEEQRTKADERIATLQGELSAEDTINREFGDKKAELEKEKAKKEAEQKKAEKMEKRLQMSQSIVEAIGNVAAGAAKGLAMGPIIGPIMAAIVTAAGAVQVGIMTKQLTKMKDGGLLHGFSHSQGGMRIMGSNVEVEGGEYVVNKQSTSKNLGLLEYINGERRGLGYSDMNTFFGQAPTTPSFLTQMMNEPSVVPQLPMRDSVDTNRILSAIDSINFQPRVSVTDINTVHESMVKVDEWTGM